MLCRNYLNLYPLKILKYIFFLIFFLFEYFAEKNEIFYKNIWRGELGIIEISSAAILFLSFLFSYKTLKYSHKRIKKFFFTRSFLFLFLFLEELSFLTKGLLPFANFYNNQNEFNIHNSKFLLEPINGGGNIWLFEINISIYTLLTTVCVLLFAFGSYIFKKKWAKEFFLDRKIAFLNLIYPINLLLTFVLQHMSLLNLDKMILNMETTEFLLYLIIFFDSLSKYKISKLDTERGL